MLVLLVANLGTLILKFLLTLNREYYLFFADHPLPSLPDHRKVVRPIQPIKHWSDRQTTGGPWEELDTALMEDEEFALGKIIVVL